MCVEEVLEDLEESALHTSPGVLHLRSLRSQIPETALGYDLLTYWLFDLEGRHACVFA
jgi:hypothetical protein